MAILGVRSFNPVWSFQDLVGLQFDDSFYMYVLTNQIPYIPEPVFHDPNMVNPWTNPIRFLANGTLPVDIYWNPEKTYRLEFRKNDGLLPPSQNDALIYLVQNYKPGEGGVTPPSSISLSTDNQITNPQFALFNYASSVTFTGISTQDIQVAPGWVLELTGTGTVTIERESLNNTTQTATNAPYALRINSTGFDDGGLVLRQRFQQAGMLWAGKVVSNTLTARIDGVSQPIFGVLRDSNNEVLGVVLTSAPGASYSQILGTPTLLSASTNPDIPPAAYIDYRLILPNNTDIYVTSFQIVTSDAGIEIAFSYEQDSVNRQIDHTYNTAYPIIPVGAIIDFAGTSTPAHYLNCNGASVLRTTYPQLFAAIGTTWGSVDANHFNLPNLNGRVTAGAGGTLPPLANTVGSTGGSATHALTIAEMPLHNHPGSTVAIATDPASADGPGTRITCNTGPGAVTVAAQGGGTLNVSGVAHTIVQPTAIVRKLIRYQ
jgi:microcystin-dependent protein